MRTHAHTPQHDLPQFYIWKAGSKPIYFDNVTVFSANPQRSTKGAVIKPSLDEDGGVDGQTIEEGLAVQGPVGEDDKAFTAHLRYGRCFRYGQPYLWITFEAWKTKKGKDKEYDLLKACGIPKSSCKGKVCLRFTILWAKQCPPQRSPLKGFSVGTSQNAQDVAVNGEVLPEFNPDNPQYYILKDTTRSVFYLTLTRGGTRDDITIGKPSVQGFADNQLMITQSGTAGRGVQLSPGGDKGMLEINFQCKPGQGASQQRITVNLDICVADTIPGDCSLQNSELASAQSVQFSFIKYCLKNPSSSLSFWIFFIFSILLAGTCGLGCVYNFQVLGNRGIDIIPGIDVLRAAIAACHRTSLFRSVSRFLLYFTLCFTVLRLISSHSSVIFAFCCDLVNILILFFPPPNYSQCPCPQTQKYQTLGQIDEDDEAPDGLQDSSFSYQSSAGDGKTTAEIAMPRRNDDGNNTLDEDDPFADVPVDEDDLSGFYDEEDDGLDSLDGDGLDGV